MLEAHESLPGAVASSTAQTNSLGKRVHAEHHASFVSCALRTTFALDIPSDASPSFAVEVGEGEVSGDYMPITMDYVCGMLTAARIGIFCE
jgi:hypothetical protein